ncbi:protein kinase-like domain, concanavalin A-like lectin/glucanase domain protein [Tanacetum coccineum]
MENTNPPPTNNPPVLPTVLRTKVVQELKELQTISAYIDSCLENIDQFLNDFENRPNKINMDDPELEDEMVNTPLVSPFLDSDDDSDDGEVLSELEEYSNAGRFRRKKIINSFDGDDLAFYCMIGFRKFVSGSLKSRRKPSDPKKIVNFVGRVKGLKVFVENFTYECDFVVLEDTTSVIDHYLGEMVLGKPFVKDTGLVYDKDEGMVKFEKEDKKIIFKMPQQR